MAQTLSPAHSPAAALLVEEIARAGQGRIRKFDNDEVYESFLKRLGYERVGAAKAGGQGCFEVLQEVAKDSSQTEVKQLGLKTLVVQAWNTGDSSNLKLALEVMTAVNSTACPHLAAPALGAVRPDESNPWAVKLSTLAPVVKGMNVWEHIQSANILAMPQAAREAATERHLVYLALPLLQMRQAGVIHRDLKEPNIMIEKGRIMRLIDFDAARVIDSREGCGLCTHAYIPPERIYNLPGRSAEAVYGDDLWAAGIVLYSLFTGGRLHPVWGWSRPAGQDGPQLLRALHAFVEDIAVNKEQAYSLIGIQSECLKKAFQICFHKVPEKRSIDDLIAACLSAELIQSCITIEDDAPTHRKLCELLEYSAGLCRQKQAEAVPQAADAVQGPMSSPGAVPISPAHCPRPKVVPEGLSPISPLDSSGPLSPPPGIAPLIPPQSSGQLAPPPGLLVPMNLAQGLEREAPYESSSSTSAPPGIDGPVSPATLKSASGPREHMDRKAEAASNCSNSSTRVPANEYPPHHHNVDWPRNRAHSSQRANHQHPQQNQQFYIHPQHNPRHNQHAYPHSTNRRQNVQCPQNPHQPHRPHNACPQNVQYPQKANPLQNIQHPQARRCQDPYRPNCGNEYNQRQGHNAGAHSSSQVQHNRNPQYTHKPYHRQQAHNPQYQPRYPQHPYRCDGNQK